MTTYYLQDLGYDGTDRDAQTWRVEADSLLEAIRLLDGYGRVCHAEPINPIVGCSTYNVYAKAPRGSGADWSRVGTVADWTGVAERLFV